MHGKINGTEPRVKMDNKRTSRACEVCSKESLYVDQRLLKTAEVNAGLSKHKEEELMYLNGQGSLRRSKKGLRQLGINFVPRIQGAGIAIKIASSVVSGWYVNIIAF